MPIKVGIGQDSHRLIKAESHKKHFKLGGISIPGDYVLEGNSDADVVLHALCNAISSISGTIVLGPVTDAMCLEQGITDSAVYVSEALKTLTTHCIAHVAIAIECKIPRLLPYIEAMRHMIAGHLHITMSDVGITATSGEELTDFGKGLGIQAIVVVTAVERRFLNL